MGNNMYNLGKERRIYQTTAANMNIYNMLGKWEVVEY